MVARSSGPRHPYRIKHLAQIQEIRTAEQYREVLELRFAAYLAAGKLPPDAAASDLASPADPQSRIYGFYLEGALVGSVAFRLPDRDSILESVDRPLSGYPHGLPPKSQVIEATKLCIDRRYRGTDLVKLIYEQGIRLLEESGRLYMIIAADRRLSRKYRIVGFKKTRYIYQGRIEKSDLLTIMIVRPRTLGLYGLLADPIRWNIFLREVIGGMLTRRQLRYSALHWFLYWLHSPLAPISRMIEARLVVPRLTEAARLSTSMPLERKPISTTVNE